MCDYKTRSNLRFPPIKVYCVILSFLNISFFFVKPLSPEQSCQIILEVQAYLQISSQI